MEDRTESLAPLLAGRAMRCVWARAQPRMPFQVTESELPHERLWSADGSTLWTRGRDRIWWQWDPDTGRRLRSATLPAPLRVPLLDDATQTRLAGRTPDGRPQRLLVAVSPGLDRVITERYPDGGSPALRSTEDGCVIRELDGMTRPFAFTTDGTRFAGIAVRERAIVVARAADGAPIQVVPFSESLSDLAKIHWAPGGGVLIINSQFPGHTRDGLTCFSIDYQRLVWHKIGYFTRAQVDRDGESVAAMTSEGAMTIWDIATGDVIRAIPKEESSLGPLLAGEPDVGVMVERLRARPIRFQTVTPILSLDPFVPKPPSHAMSEDESAAALRSLLVPAESANAGPTTSDGRLAVFFLHRNVYEVPDPDAGSVVHSDPSIALWDRHAKRWLWETSESPEYFVLGWLLGHGSIALSWDESGLFARGQGRTSLTLYDLATGALRPARAGDSPPMPDDRKPLATARALELVLAAHQSVIELYSTRTRERIDAIDLAAIGDAPKLAGEVPGKGTFVVGTMRGLLLGFELIP